MSDNNGNDAHGDFDRKHYHACRWHSSNQIKKM